MNGKTATEHGNGQKANCKRQPSSALRAMEGNGQKAMTKSGFRGGYPFGCAAFRARFLAASMRQIA